MARSIIVCRENTSAPHLRVTWWYGQAWEKLCERFDFEGVFDKCGSSLTADGSEDDRIKLQKLDSVSFDLNDANRLPTTGEFPETEAIKDAITVRATENDDAGKEIVEDHGEAEGREAEDEEDGGETSDDDLEREDFVYPAGLKFRKLVYLLCSYKTCNVHNS